MSNAPFLRKLFIAFFLIATCYACFAAGVWFYKNSQIDSIKKEGDEKIFFQQASSQMDMKFMVALNLIQELKSNDDIIKYASDPTNYYYITQVYNRLRKGSMASNNFGYKVDVFERSSDLVITPNKTIDTESYYHEMGFTAEDLRKIGDYFKSPSKSDILFLRHRLADSGEMPDPSSFSIIKRETVDYTSEMIFIITFAEKQFFPDWPGMDQEGIGFVMNEDVMLSKSALTDTKMAQLLSNNKFASQIPTYLRTEASSYYIHTIGSSMVEEIHYFYITPKHLILAKIKALSWKALGIYILLLAFGYGIALWIARKVYRPVRNVVSSIWIASEAKGLDEFSLIMEKISHLQHSNDLLQETIEHNSKLLKGTFLRDLVYGALSGEALADGLRKHGLEWLEKGGSIILLRWTGEDLAMKLNKTESALIEESMVRSVREFVNQRLEWFEFKNHDYVFLVAEKDPGIIKKSIRKVMYRIHTEYGISMLAAIGQQAMDAHGWEQTFHSATSMLEDDSTVSRQLILTYDGFTQRNATQYYYPLELERDIIHMVIQRRKDRLEALTNHLFQENMERRKIGKDMLNQFIYSLHNTFRRVLHQINETEDSLFGPETSLLSQMKSCEGGNGLREAVIGMFSYIVDHIQRTNKELDDSMSDRMLAFIHENYQKDISLVDLSEQFNASPAYISILFKNYTGENFKEYLNMYRVEKAKQLLQNNKLLKIHEVAGMVGCNHPNTFIRMFKKYEGISPGSYAKQSFE